MAIEWASRENSRQLYCRGGPGYIRTELDHRLAEEGSSRKRELGERTYPATPDFWYRRGYRQKKRRYALCQSDRRLASMTRRSLVDRTAGVNPAIWVLIEKHYGRIEYLFQVTLPVYRVRSFQAQAHWCAISENKDCPCSQQTKNLIAPKPEKTKQRRSVSQGEVATFPGIDKTSALTGN